MKCQWETSSGLIGQHEKPAQAWLVTSQWNEWTGVQAVHLCIWICGFVYLDLCVCKHICIFESVSWAVQVSQWPAERAGGKLSWVWICARAWWSYLPIHIHTLLMHLYSICIQICAVFHNIYVCLLYLCAFSSHYCAWNHRSLLPETVIPTCHHSPSQRRHHLHLLGIVYNNLHNPVIVPSLSNNCLSLSLFSHHQCKWGIFIEGAHFWHIWESVYRSEIKCWKYK